MATVSSAELREVRDELRALLSRVQALLDTQANEEKAAARLGQPTARMSRIP